MPTVLENLQAARALIADRKNWITGHLRVFSDDGQAQYCALGAVDHVLGRMTQSTHDIDPCTPEILALNAVSPLRGLDSVIGSIYHVNDAFGHKATLEMFDRAIEAQREHPTEKL